MATLRTLFLNPPRSGLRSIWFPTRLAQAAALIPNSKLIDAPADGLELDEVLRRARGFELCVIQASASSFDDDAEAAAALKTENPGMRIGFVGSGAAALPEKALEEAPALDFLARDEFDGALLQVAEGRPYADVAGLSYRDPRGAIVHNQDRTALADLDALPSVLDVYRRDLVVSRYFLGCLKHPYLALHTGGGRAVRARSAAAVVAEAARAKELFPEVEELFFDDEAFTADLARAAEIARGLGRLGLSWSCNSRADVPRDRLKLFKENGLRLLRVDYESGSRRILADGKTGGRLERARQFTRDCRKLGIAIHGSFVIGLPGETQETIDESIAFACELNVDSIQVSPAPDALRSRLPAVQLEQSVKRFYARFYARPTPIFRILLGMARHPRQLPRRLGEGRRFLDYLRGRRRPPAAADR